MLSCTQISFFKFWNSVPLFCSCNYIYIYIYIYIEREREERERENKREIKVCIKILNGTIAEQL